MSGSKTPRGGKGRVRATRPATSSRGRNPAAELPAAAPADKVAEALRAPLPSSPIGDHASTGPVAEPVESVHRPVLGTRSTLADVVAGVMAAVPATPDVEAFVPGPSPSVDRPAPAPAEAATHEGPPPADDRPVAPGEFATAMSLTMLDLYRQGVEANIAYWTRLFEPPSPARAPERD